MAQTACALHILVKHEAQALDLMKQLAAGANFQQLAKKYSTCPSKNAVAIWGSLKGDMVPAFDKAVFSCEVMKPFGPVKTRFGYHIIKVLFRT